jgi:HEPN domain-containing protein
VTLLAHDIREVNHEIRIGQYFFADVASEGIALYDSVRFKLAKPKAHTPAERLDIALFNFRYWFQSAGGFWRGAGYYMAEGLGPHAAFLLHQATERYFHAVLLVYTGYKPRSHDIEALASQTAPMHEALQGVLPRAEGEDARLFDLLKRAYIEARYSKSYHITLDELAALRRHVLDLAERVRRACTDKLATITEDGEIGELPALPTPSDSIELPRLPALDDPLAVEVWREAIVQMSQERGEQRFREGEQLGEERGRREGDERVREERARAILDVLQRRGIALSDAQLERIATCRDEATLARWRELAWTAGTGDELIAASERAV